MKLIIQPEDGPSPLLSAFKSAKKSIEIAIFRLDRIDVERALKAAVQRGVKVTALIAQVSRGGEKSLRNLETRFLEAGITVARTSDDLIRYHDKIFIIDKRVFYLLSFNFTHMDIDHSRGFGIITKNPTLVQEAGKLFDADCQRRPYTASSDTFVVSPANSRRVLRGFLKRAKKELLIYDPQISDKEMIRTLQERAKAGVEIKFIGQLTGGAGLTAHKLTRMRLHTRTIIRDGRQAFVGSQSLRPAELDARREAGLILRDASVVKKLQITFEADWATIDGAREHNGPNEEADVKKPVPKKDAEKAAAVLVHELRPVTDTVKKAVKKVLAQAGEQALHDKIVKTTVKKIVKKAVKQAVKEVVENAAQD